MLPKNSGAQFSADDDEDDKDDEDDEDDKDDDGKYELLEKEQDKPLWQVSPMSDN